MDEFLFAAALANQERARAFLDRLLATGKVPPAILLAGPAGAGKAALALSFARDFLCQTGTNQACGSCLSCRQAAAMSHPDLVLFSSRDLAAESTRLVGLAGRAALVPMQVLARRALAWLANLYLHGLFEVKRPPAEGGGRRKAGEEAAERLAALEARINGAADAEALSGALEQIALLAGAVPNGTLPIDGVRALITLLGRTPFLSPRRVVLIEGIETLRVEGANALLKSIEEPPPGTVFLLTAADLRQVLITIRSRSAIVPVPRMSARVMETLVRERWGVGDAPEASGVRDLAEYLERCRADSTRVHEALVEFFECLGDDAVQAGIFAFFKRLGDSELAVPFLRYLQEVAVDAWQARCGIRGGELLLPHLLDPLPDRLLQALPAECDRLLRRITRNNLNVRLALAALYSGLRQGMPRSA